ncbi:hypothetical protein L7F22_030333 [Adiantum nelumboides]|nr:hypothetical protein [Adiantum nelumboides]
MVLQQFADDTNAITGNDSASIEKFMDSLNTFCLASGSIINYAKIGVRISNSLEEDGDEGDVGLGKGYLHRAKKGEAEPWVVGSHTELGERDKVGGICLTLLLQLQAEKGRGARGQWTDMARGARDEAKGGGRAYLSMVDKQEEKRDG